MSKWVVTGASGFIGSNIIKRLINDGHDVFGIDNFLNSNDANIYDYKDKFTFIDGDIRDADTCMKLCDGADYVVHQAALGSIPRSIKDPYASNDVNVNGFLNMMLAAKQAKVKKFVYASSGSVYGDSDVLPKVEHIIGNPLSPYAAMKQINEIYAKVFSKVYDFDSIGLRYFNVYGPNQKCVGPYVTIIPLWCRSFIQNEQIYVNGDGNISRDFCYVDDVVEANILAATSDLKKAHVFNVGSGSNTSLDDLFLMFKEIFNRDTEIIYKDFRIGDTMHTLADLTNIKSKLGYYPKYDIIQGLTKTTEWYKKYLS